MSARPPRPESLSCWLVSAGIHRPTWTRHDYVDTRLVELPGDGAAWEHLFRCGKTGAVRRWGTADVLEVN